MTFSEEFPTDTELGFGEESKHPTIFGVTLTPVVIGIICGAAGFVGAIYLLMTMVLPAQESYKQLAADKQAKEAQLEQLQSGEIERTIDNLQSQLEQARTIEPQVLSLFSSEETLNTLLLDINKFVDSSDAELLSYTPEGEAVVVDDGSLGELVNGKLKRKSFNLQLEGTFGQTQTFMRALERLQPLLVVKNLRSNLVEQPSYVVNQGSLVMQGQPELQTTFTVDALIPVNEAAIEAANQEANGTDEAASE